VRVPVHVAQTLRFRQRVSEALLSELGRAPTPAELDTAVRARGGVVLSRDMALAADAATSTPISFDKPVAMSDSDGVPFGDFVASPDDLEADALTTALRCETAALLATHLSPRERWIVERIHGFHDGPGWTLEACGKALGLSRERVRQLHGRALKRLRRALQRTDEHRPSG
jgi:RNA polymerase primary sigma factor